MNETIKSGLKICLCWNALVGVSLLFNLDKIMQGHSVNVFLAIFGIALGFISAFVLGDLMGGKQ